MLEYPKALVAFLENTLGIPEHHQLAYGSTFLISFAPFLLLFLIRVENTPAHRNYLRIALSFASGGLLGDAFIHLIPHAISPHHHHEESHGHGHDHGHDHHGHDHSHDHGHHHHDHDHGHSHAHDHHGHDHARHDHAHEHAHAHGHAHDHGHDHFQQTMVGLYIVCGVIFFFLMEKFIIFLKGGSGHGHSHSHDAPLKKKSKSNKPKKAKQSDDEGDDDDKPLIASGGEQKNRAVSGFLNLFADFLHNFTDGLAIGATFSTTKSMGAITAFSIFAHEIPHEIGDYAILIQAGYKRSSAIGLQLVTAIGAMIGTYVGLHFGTMDQATTFILPITAGGFIYIATVSIIPELLEKTHSYIQAAAELIALGTGVAMMFWIALNE